MVLTKTMFGACGACAVGASYCTSTRVQSGLGACTATDVTVDSWGDVWFTSTAQVGSYEDPRTCSAVWICSVLPVKGTLNCTSLGLFGGNWSQPAGIAVDRGEPGPGHQTTVYVSELGHHAMHGEPAMNPGIRKCTFWSGGSHMLECNQFGSNWDTPQGLDLDSEGNVFVTNGHVSYLPKDPSIKSNGVWKCSPAGDCALVGGSDHWQQHPASFDDKVDVRVDSKGNVYVTGQHENPNHGPSLGYTEKCTSTGTCADFGTHQISSHQALGLAVSPDDHVFIRDVDSFVRCSPDGLCEDIASCHGGIPNGTMAMHEDRLYSIARDGHAQLELRKFYFGFATDTFQV